MSAEKYPGLLVAFEGVDGAGKSTAARRVVAALESAGTPAIYLREPTDMPHGARLRQQMAEGRAQLTPHQEFELFLLDRQDDVTYNIVPALRAGKVVCIDRYYISSMAYQGALGLDSEEIRRANEAFAPVPDLVLIFDIPVEESQRRIRASRASGPNEYEGREYQRRVRELLLGFQLPNSVVVDAMASEEEVFARVLGVIQKLRTEKTTA